MKSWKVVWWVALALAAAYPLAASTFMQLDTTALVTGSSAVIEGEVLSVESHWDSEGQVIVSEATVHVRDTVYGDASSLVKIKTFGGEVDGYRIEASGFPKFNRGDRVFLFVREDESEKDMLRITGYLQGQFMIVKDANGVDQAMPAVDESVRLVNRAGVLSAPAVSTMPLEELKQLVRDHDRLREPLARDRPHN